jgi:GT2 family glycosyltransferase
MDATRIPVIVLQWNGWEDTFECLRSLNASPDAGEVWLADNASEEDRVREAKEIRSSLRYLRFDRNYGFAGGYNRALRLAKRENYEFAYLLNNDTVVAPGFLSSVLRVAMADAALAAVGSVILHYGSNFIEHDGTYHPRGRKVWNGTVGGATRPDGPEVRRPAFTSGAGMLVRLEAMERGGYFDERFFFCWEDAEWCWRMERHGLGLRICLESVVFHKGGQSDKDGNAHYYRTRNRFLLLDSVGDPVVRKGAVRELMYEAAVQAEFSRRAGDWVSWRALAQAIDDGLKGGFGRRNSARLGIKAIGRMAAWCVRAHGHDKVRALRGLRPGYGTASVSSGVSNGGGE